MECCIDFISCLDSDMSLKIFSCLDDPADLVRVSSVSRSWRHYVITNGFCKQMCLRMFPQLSRVACVVELNQQGVKEPTEVGTSNSNELLTLQRDHRVYANLARSLMSSAAVNCIAKTIGASSTDNFPQESIDNTLDPRDNIAGRYSYWSSNGQSNPNVAETLTYELGSQICVISEINIHPFQAHFQMGSPIYSAKSVRFKIGHVKTSFDSSDDELFAWTYTSPEFPMTQENRLQKFNLPEPVLCIGGILQIELLGRVQTQEMDGLLYICVSYVQAMGFPLSPAFSVEILEPSGMFVLKNNQRATCSGSSENESGGISIDYFKREHFHQMFTLAQRQLIGIGFVEEDDWDEEEEEQEQDEEEQEEEEQEEEEEEEEEDDDDDEADDLEEDYAL